MSMEVALSEFYDRLMLHVLSGMAKSIVLSVILFATFFYIVGRPLLSLRRAIGEVDAHEPQAINVIGRGHRNDEIGALQNALNSLLEASKVGLQNLKKTQEELVENERRMNDFARAGSDWFWETDANHLPVFSSEGFFEKSGRDPDTYFEEFRNGIIQGEEPYVSRIEKLRTALSTRKSFRNLELLMEKADGTTIHVIAGGVPVFEGDGGFAGFRGVIADRTDLQVSEAERERLTEELSHAQRLRAVGQLTGGIAHDFNNMLAVIMGCVELVQATDLDEKKRERALAMALDATKRGAVLTHRLLAYSRQQPLSPQSLDSKDVLTSLDDLLRRSLGETVELEMVANGGAWRCFADRQELETVILNLAINSRDAMPDGGKLTIEVFNSRLDEAYARGGLEVTAGQYVCFAVTDTGTGMDEKTAARAFDPYFTTKPIGQGSGFGLSMAFGFAKQSGGHIKIYSELGKGTTVKVYLPKSVSGSAHKFEIIDHVPNLEMLEGCRILVVEDDEDVRQTIEMHLARTACEVVTAVDPADALEKCAKHAKFDIFLLDVVLPGTMKSPDLAMALLEIDPGTAVIYMSGYTENSIVHGGQLDEGVRLLQKPFSSAELKASLIRALINSEIQIETDG